MKGKYIRAGILAVMFLVAAVTWGRAHAELTQGECMQRGEVAYSMATDMLAHDGKLDEKKIVWNSPPTEEDLAWWAAFQSEVEAAYATVAEKKLDEPAQRVGQAVMELCMYRLGEELRENLEKQRDKHDEQTQMKKTASSQGIIGGESSGWAQECVHEAHAAGQIFKLSKNVKQEDWFIVYPIPDGFSDDAAVKIHDVVDLAYKLHKENKGDPVTFAHTVYEDCRAEQ